MNLLVAKRALGLFSIGLGVVAVAAPRGMSRRLGLQADEQAVSAFGAREIAAGAGLLSPVKPGPWFWMRVVGDVMDLVALRSALGRDNPRRRMAILAGATVATITVIDLVVAVQALRDRRANARAAA